MRPRLVRGFRVVYAGAMDASAMIDARITELGGWRGPLLARVRAAIHAAEPAVEETWKWRGTPVWERGGIICTGESHKHKLKLTFAHGASLADPTGLFNAKDTGHVRRAIDLYEGAAFDETAFAALIQAAAAFNLAKKKR